MNLLDHQRTYGAIERDGSVVPIALSGIGPDLVRYAVVA